MYPWSVHSLFIYYKNIIYIISECHKLYEKKKIIIVLKSYFTFEEIYSFTLISLELVWKLNIFHASNICMSCLHVHKLKDNYLNYYFHLIWILCIYIKNFLIYLTFKRYFNTVYEFDSIVNVLII